MTNSVQTSNINILTTTDTNIIHANQHPNTHPNQHPTNLKFPNGFGSITKKTDKNRRKPYLVRKFIDGRQQQIGSFETYEAAYNFLVAYNADPSMLLRNKVTFADVYERMAKERYPKLAEATINNYKVAYKYCTSLLNKPLSHIKVLDLQNIITELSNQGIGYASQKKCKQLISLVYAHAAKYDLITDKTDPTQYLDLDKNVKVFTKRPFTAAQLRKVQRLIDDNHKFADYARCILMMCYCGCRPSEFLNIKREDVDLKQRVFIVRESKTEAGRNRQVPIHKSMLIHYKYFTEGGNLRTSNPRISPNLITDATGKTVSYPQFRVVFAEIMELIGCKHTPHECRHTCATWLDNAGANDVATKRILGHACPGVTKGVYTHKTLSDLRKAIDSIKIA